MSHKPSEDITNKERRKFDRAYFSSKEAVTGIASLPTQNISGTITELSTGGLYFIITKSDALNLKAGTTLILKEIQATILNCLELNVEMKTISIHNYEFVEHVGLGCDFAGIPGKDIELIGQLVEWGRKANMAT